MAQKSNPLSTRFTATALWKNIWAAPRLTQHVDFKKTWMATHLLKKFYTKQGFDVLALRIEKTTLNFLFFVSIRKKLPERTGKIYDLVKFAADDNSLDLINIYPRLSRTLPRAIPLQKLRIINNSWLQLKLIGTHGTKKTPDLSKLVTKYNRYEFTVLLKNLATVCQQSVLIIKSHPAAVLDAMPTAEYISVYVRQQLLFSVKKKKRVIPLRYFRQVANYLMSRFTGYLRGIRLQIKGRLPKLGGSAGAARSKKQLLSLGYLSTQRLLSPIDYSYVDLGSRSGICSLSVWISYTSPLSKVK